MSTEPEWYRKSMAAVNAGRDWFDDGGAMKHTYERHDNCELMHCPVCDGGLQHCTTCGCFEGSLTTDCPGEKVNYDRQQEIYQCKVDFIDGQWTDTRAPRAALANLLKWIEAGGQVHPGTTFSGEHPMTVAREALARPQEKFVEIARVEESDDNGLVTRGKVSWTLNPCHIGTILYLKEE